MSTVSRTALADDFQPLITRTDLQGTLNFCNDAFAQTSGYDRDVLIGKPYKLLRHPDMPAAVFDDMWQTLQQGRPWMGLIKNRCRNGEAFWVDLYIMRVFDGDRHVGYGALGRPANVEQVLRANALYEKFNNNMAWQTRLGGQLQAALPLLGLSAVSAGLLGLSGASWQQMALPTLPLIALHIWLYRCQRNDVRDLLEQYPTACGNALSAQVYSGQTGFKAQLGLALRSCNARLHTALLRIGIAGELVEQRAIESAERVSQDAHLLERQRSETDQAAAAISQMSSTIQEVAGNVHTTAQAAADADQLAQQGFQLSSRNLDSMRELSGAVNEISLAIGTLAASSEAIVGVVDVITAIAEQTNLLALNAAIEAARAGEQGRGFAVVADEVRSLASRTRESTGQIQQLIVELRANSNRAVQMAAQGKVVSDTCAADVGSVGQALEGITGAISKISGMSQHMAAAVEEQTQVIDDINRQITHIAELSDQSAASAQTGSRISLELRAQAESLRGLALRFDR